MRKTAVIIVAVVAIAFSFNSVYSSVLRLIPCKEPITYKIGTIDPRFGVTKEEFIQDIGKAGNIWSTAINKNLFAYDPKGRMTINLIYDDRQKITQEENQISIRINETSQTADSIKRQYEALEAKYQSLKQSYDAALANYTNGRPSRAEQQVLEEKRQELNQTATEINALVAKYNMLVKDINTNINTINNDGLTGTQFEEGQYVSDASGQRIDIYQFDNQTYFIRVLAHELGHSLGLNHNDNFDSIMNPVNTSTNLKLTAEDLRDVKKQCRITS